MDFVLRLAQRGLWKWKSTRVVLDEPASLSGTKPGHFEQPDRATWSPDVLSDPRRASEREIGGWVAGCLGEEILSAIRNAGTRDEDGHRLLFTSDPDELPRLVSTPWEVLESVHGNLAAGIHERFSVCRVLHPEPSATLESLPVTGRLRLVVTWADPAADIPGIDQHLKAWRTYCARHEEVMDLRRVCEFTDVSAVLGKLAESQPHLWYHLGHAVQAPSNKVKLRVGSRGNPHDCDLPRFRRLLSEVGPPRLLLLNACASLSGWQPEFMLGVSALCTRDVGTLIAMSTSVPVNVAFAFAEEFFQLLGKGRSFIDAVAAGRRAIYRKCVKLEDEHAFYPFIPSVLHYSRQPAPIAIDVGSRQAERLVKQLRLHIEKLRYYLPRTCDSAVKDLLLRPPCNVGLIWGPSQAGKSTTLKRALRELMTVERYKQGERSLYFQAAPCAAENRENSLARQTLDVLADLASQFDETRQLRVELNRLYGAEDREGLAVLASWLSEEEKADKRYRICIDGLPGDAVAYVLKQATRVLDGESLLVLTAKENVSQSNWPVSTIELGLLDNNEIETAVQASGLAAADVSIQQAVANCGRLPHLLYLFLDRARAGAAQPVADDLLAAFGVSQQEHELLSFVALCQQRVPRMLLEELHGEEVVRSLTMDKPLLLQSESEDFSVPEMVRNELLASAGDHTSEEALNRRFAAYSGFAALADQHADSLDTLIVSRVNGWYREALEHILQLAAAAHALGDVQSRAENLEGAMNLAQILDQRRFERHHDAGIAMEVWKLTRGKALEMGCYDLRRANFHYARCLFAFSDYGPAEELLEEVTFAGTKDRFQVLAFLLWSNLLKDRDRGGEGGEGDWQKRLNKLRQAQETAEAIMISDGIDPDDVEWARQQLPHLKYTRAHLLGYGLGADIEQALRLLKEAETLFLEAGDALHYYRTVAEQIEIRRYNELLTDDQRQEAINTIERNYSKLLPAGYRYDAVRHLYELGRLELDPAASSKWFRAAADLAADRFNPLGIHANAFALMRAVESQPQAFSEHAEALEQYVEQLWEFVERAWSRRVLRRCITFLAQYEELRGNRAAALAHWRKACDVLETMIQNYREGRGDRKKREFIATAIGKQAVAQASWEDARRALRLLDEDPGQLTIDELRARFASGEALS